MPQDEIARETLFNAGVDIALNISKIVKEAEYYASTGNYASWHLKLEAFERRMWTKFREKEEAEKEINKIKEIGLPKLRTFLLKSDSDKKISRALTDEVKGFLTTYEKSLIYWRDKFGYGMPLKDDARFALS